LFGFPVALDLGAKQAYGVSAPKKKKRERRKRDTHPVAQTGEGSMPTEKEKKRKKRIERGLSNNDFPIQQGSVEKGKFRHNNWELGKKKKGGNQIVVTLVL